MKTNRSHHVPVHPVPAAFPLAAGGRLPRPCASASCHNLVFEAWEETGTLCASCAVEGDLADREGRWARLGETVH